MREKRQTIFDALFKAHEHGLNGQGVPASAAHEFEEALDKAGFQIVRKPESPGIVIRATTTHADGRVEVRTNETAEQGAPAQTVQEPLLLPEGVTDLTLATDVKPGGIHLCVFGRPKGSDLTWLLKETFIPAQRPSA
jgi:hypothetical protein